jgi:hypothetical protein
VRAIDFRLEGIWHDEVFLRDEGDVDRKHCSSINLTEGGMK